MLVFLTWVILCGLVHAEDVFIQPGQQKPIKEVDPRLKSSIYKSRIDNLAEIFRKRLEYLKEGNKKEVGTQIFLLSRLVSYVGRF